MTAFRVRIGKIRWKLPIHTNPAERPDWMR
jgi:hypothetical protein